MQAESEQIVRLLVVLDEFLAFVEHVTLNEAVERSIDVQGIDIGEPARMSNSRMASSCRNVPNGHCASGVASGRVTKSFGRTKPQPWPGRSRPKQASWSLRRTTW